MPVHLQIGETTYQIRRLKAPKGTVAIGLISPRGGRDSEVICVDLTSGDSCCSCAHGCGECRHIKAIRLASRKLNGLDKEPEPKIDSAAAEGQDDVNKIFRSWNEATIRRQHRIRRSIHSRFRFGRDDLAA